MPAFLTEKYNYTRVRKHEESDNRGGGSVHVGTRTCRYALNAKGNAAGDESLLGKRFSCARLGLVAEQGDTRRWVADPRPTVSP